MRAGAGRQPVTSKAFSGPSPRMQEIHSLIPFIGRSDAPVLIQGETGCGKEVFARELHAIPRGLARCF